MYINALVYVCLHHYCVFTFHQYQVLLQCQTEKCSRPSLRISLRSTHTKVCPWGKLTAPIYIVPFHHLDHLKSSSVRISILLLCHLQLGIVIDLKEKVARSSISTPTPVCIFNIICTLYKFVCYYHSHFLVFRAPDLLEMR